MNYQWVVTWSSFGRENSRDRRRVCRICAKTINCLGGKGHWRRDAIFDRLDGVTKKHGILVLLRGFDIVCVNLTIFFISGYFRNLKSFQVDDSRETVVIWLDSPELTVLHYGIHGRHETDFLYIVSES